MMGVSPGSRVFRGAGARIKQTRQQRRFKNLGHVPRRLPGVESACPINPLVLRALV